MKTEETYDERFQTKVLLEELPRQWGWLLALGILMVVLGTIGMGVAFYVPVASVLIYSGFLIGAGILQLWQGIKAKETAWSGRTQQFLVALFYLAIAALIIWDPIAASVGLTLFLGALLAGIGVIRIADALRCRRAGWQWTWTLIAGILNLILAAIILFSWPFSGLWVIGLFISIEMIINGWLLIFVSLEVHKKDQKVAGSTL
ncbi:MAG: HdeD family acid-resistance protein [Methylobacter sp.]